MLAFKIANGTGVQESKTPYGIYELNVRDAAIIAKFLAIQGVDNTITLYDVAVLRK